MPLDPSIPLGAGKFNSPFEHLDRMLQTQQNQQVVRSNQAKADVAQRQEQEYAGFQKMLAEAPDLSDATLDVLVRKSPTFGVKFRSELIKQRQDSYAAMETESKVRAAEAERGLGLLSVAMATPEKWSVLRPMIADLVPDLAPVLPEQFDPNALAAFRDFGLKAKERNDRDVAAMRDLGKGEYGSLAAALEASEDPAERAEKLQAWRMAGVPAGVLASLAKTPSAFMMTPDERVDNVRADATQAAVDGRAGVDDARADAELGISRGQLSLAQKREAREAAGGNEPLQAIVGPDGKPVLVPRSQAVGKQPAGGRGQGGTRSVTSGDSDDLSVIQTSLDDVAVLKKTLPAGSTGTVSRIGAAMPGWVTEVTGWGADAKAKQAMIDRVKQVIGKALEGGVLRKEDELKYEKILPTIKDPTPVVTAKLTGLESAIRMRQQRKLESLEDADYDTTAFRNRLGKPAESTTTEAPKEMKIGPYTVRVKP